MKVSAQYARDHFDELAQAAERGEEIEIARDNRPTLMLMSKPEVSKLIATRPRSELFDSWKGIAWMSDDFDSPEVNKEIEADFLNGPLYPGGEHH